MATPRKFKKGDSVVLHGLWNNFDGLGVHNHTVQVVYTQRCTVLSWGAKQASLADTDTGQPIRLRVYTAQTDHITSTVDHDYIDRLVALHVAKLRRFADNTERRAQLGTGRRNAARYIAGLRKAANAIEAGAVQVVDRTELMDRLCTQ